ncbi:MAG: 50S ribosomal protein L35 [Actinomycetota bacterium]|nr:50S ribosomal protein L35 [Actinomycetota bacterium]
MTGTGKLLRRKAMQSHLLEKKSSKRKRGFRKLTEVKAQDKREVVRLLGGKKR